MMIVQYSLNPFKIKKIAVFPLQPQSFIGCILFAQHLIGL